MTEPYRKRRALSHVGGAIQTEGDRNATADLAEALTVAPSTDDADDPGREHVHGFHTYPARMHPVTANRLLKAFVPKDKAVLDPFCGSGTVLVEAAILGIEAAGVDLNPLACLLARAKTQKRSAPEIALFLETAQSCADHATLRRKAKAGATRRFTQEDVKLFEPHVLLELDSLRDKIMSITNRALHEDVQLVLSSILGKLSLRFGDTTPLIRKRQTAAGYPSRLFVARAQEWMSRCQRFAELQPTHAKPPLVIDGNALELAKFIKKPVAAMITSPPYAATYDYLEHHALRLRWLGLPSRQFTMGEWGSRREYTGLNPSQAEAKWRAQLADFFRSAGPVLIKRGLMILLIADSAISSVALRADKLVSEVAQRTGFEPLARASQIRPHFHAATQAAFQDQPRMEHALLLRKI